ncbi:hypothetical protein ACFO4N_04930 [Camelliibacillus cellulosilyticus]|uniref:Uncharacterized protein n=1 Tax=Camelliibacillus cellulosilyticus TaxID=2174486 RepID=A0ABV9GJ37_9BACL
MMVGIGVIGVVTGTMTPIFTNSNKTVVPPELDYVREKIEKHPDNR